MLLETIRALFVFPPHQSSRPTHFALAIAHTQTHTLCTYVLRIVYGPRVANCFQQFKESRCSTFNERPAAWATIRAYCRFHIYNTIHFGAQSFQNDLWRSSLVGQQLSWPCTYFRRLPTNNAFELFVYIHEYIYIFETRNSNLRVTSSMYVGYCGAAAAAAVWAYNGDVGRHKL